MTFYSLSTPRFNFIWQSTLILLFKINLSFSLSKLSQLIFSFTWLSYTSPRHVWFSTSHCNCVLFFSSPCCGCILLLTLSLQYHCDYTFCDNLLLILVTTVLFLSLHLIMILFSSYPCLVDINLPTLVKTISLPRRYHFSYPCCNILLLAWIVFYLYWLLLFSLLQSLELFYLSLYTLLIFFSLSLCLVYITLTIIHVIVF